MNTKNEIAFSRLVAIMDELRQKCPWDKKQTIQTLRQMTIEETFELADAITDNDWKGVKEELGDLLLHIVFYAIIGREQKQFELDEMINGICDKLVSRHPHIYGDPANGGQLIEVNNSDDVKRNWEKLKLKEGKKSVIEGIPRSLPATIKAMRLQEKAKQTGFEWDNKEQVWEKVEEELQELQLAVSNLQSATNNQQPATSNQQPVPSPKDLELLQGEVEEEFGDVVFSLINYARFLQVDAENALEKTNKKFINRFTQMEQQALQNGKSLNDMTLQEMDAIWNTIKQQRKDS
ncbi:MAG: nucleoside triphosphate pyrophosphohydrolase [Chitinophagaceae bacterium]|nr:nucleoside triphosphate pyrophosphohydrolase [Chitinophagaceae bacterium]